MKNWNLLNYELWKQKIKVTRYDKNTHKEYEDEVDEILLTNMSEEEMSVEDLKEIYKLRWGIEVDFDTLKNRFDIENFTWTIKLTHQQVFILSVHNF